VTTTSGELGRDGKPQPPVRPGDETGLAVESVAVGELIAQRLASEEILDTGQ